MAQMLLQRFDMLGLLRTCRGYTNGRACSRAAEAMFRTD